MKDIYILKTYLSKNECKMIIYIKKIVTTEVDTGSAEITS